MHNILSCQGNTNQNISEIPSYSCKNCKIKNNNGSLLRRRCGERRSLVQCWWEWHIRRPLWKSIWPFLSKMGISLKQDFAVPLLSINPHIAQSYNKDICSVMFKAALFVIARKGSNLDVPQLYHKWRKIHSQNVVLLRRKKSNGILKFAGKHMALEETILSEGAESLCQKQNRRQERRYHNRGRHFSFT